MGPVNARPPALAPGELLRSVGLVAVPAGDDRELLYNEHTGAAKLLTYEDGDILGLCRVFRTVEGHARAICQEAGLPEEHLPALVSQISLLARSGLLVRRGEILERMARPAPAPVEPLDAAPAVEGATAGARLNALLLASRGRRVLLGHVPSRGPTASAPVAFVSEPSPIRSEGAPDGPVTDGRAEHARVLGASPAELAGPDVDLDGLDARFLRRLKAGGGVVVATSQGTPARFVDRLTVTNRPYALDGPLGLDNRLPLPPAPSIDAGAREVFLLVVRKVWDRALLALLPGVVDVPAPPAVPGTRMADLFLALLSPFELGPARPEGEPRLRALAAHLTAVAALPAAELRRLLLPLLRTAAARDAKRKADLDVPVDVPDAHEAIVAYARLLESWPEAAR